MLGSIAKQTLVAAALAWLATRVLRRAVGVALLTVLFAGAADLAERRAIDVRGVDRITRWGASALLEVIRQLPDAIARGVSSTERALPKLARLARCDGDRTPTRTPPR